LTLHALAVLSGIIAILSLVLASKNKIVLFLIFSIITGCFELTIPFLTPSQGVSIEKSPQKVSLKKPPNLVLCPVKFGKTHYLQLEKGNNIIKVMTRINIKNFGETTASNITYPNSFLKATFSAKKFKVDKLPSNETPILLPPSENFFYQPTIEIVDLPSEQLEKLLEEFNKDEFFVNLQFEAKYNQLGSNKYYAVSAEYKITKSYAMVLRYEEIMIKN